VHPRFRYYKEVSSSFCDRIDMQEGVMMEALLDSRAIELVMSSEFTRKQKFKLKKIKRPIFRIIEREQR